MFCPTCSRFMLNQGDHALSPISVDCPVTPYLHLQKIMTSSSPFGAAPCSLHLPHHSHLHYVCFLAIFSTELILRVPSSSSSSVTLLQFIFFQSFCLLQYLILHDHNPMHLKNGVVSPLTMSTQSCNQKHASLTHSNNSTRLLIVTPSLEPSTLLLFHCNCCLTDSPIFAR